MKKITFTVLTLVYLVGCSEPKIDVKLDNEIPASSIELGEEFTKMLKYSFNYLNETDILELEDESAKIDLVQGSISSYFEEELSYDSKEIEDLHSLLATNYQKISNTTLKNSSAIILSDAQVAIFDELLLIVEKQGIYSFSDYLDPVFDSVKELPENETEIIYNYIAILSSMFTFFAESTESNLKSTSSWDWGSFLCNAAAGGIGAVYGAAVGAFCIPCGVVVGVATGAALGQACP